MSKTKGEAFKLTGMTRDCEYAFSEGYNAGYEAGKAAPAQELKSLKTATLEELKACNELPAPSQEPSFIDELCTMINDADSALSKGDKNKALGLVRQLASMTGSYREFRERQAPSQEPVMSFAEIREGIANAVEDWPHNDYYPPTIAEMIRQIGPTPQAAPSQEHEIVIGLLREARDNCQASIVEEGISADRKAYRIELETRLTAMIATLKAPSQEQMKAIQDCLAGGTGILKDGKRIDPKDFYAAPLPEYKRGMTLQEIADSEYKAPSQEPVAWVEAEPNAAQSPPEMVVAGLVHSTAWHFKWPDNKHPTKRQPANVLIPLYTTPPDAAAQIEELERQIADLKKANSDLATAAIKPEAPSQPAAWCMVSTSETIRFTEDPSAKRELEGYGWKAEPLYRVPPDAAAQIAELQQMIKNAEEKLDRASEATGIYAGCDTPDELADEVVELRGQIDKLKAQISEPANETIARMLIEEAELKEQIATLEVALSQIAEGAKTQGAHTGMSWSQVAQIADAAMEQSK